LDTGPGEAFDFPQHADSLAPDAEPTLWPVYALLILIAVAMVSPLLFASDDEVIRFDRKSCCRGKLRRALRN